MGELKPAQVEAVLERLGFSRAPEPDLAGLRAIYAAWCRRVPFDNVRKRIHVAAGDPGPLPGDEPADFFADWLADGTGGTCWAGNGALCALLEALGFDAVRGVGTMLVAPDLPPNHGTVIVALGDARWIVDASILTSEPLRFPEPDPTEVSHPAWGVTADVRDGLPVIRWRPMHMDALDCRIDATEATPAEFRQRHEATRAWSPFNHAISARLLCDDGRVVGAAMGQLAEITPDGTRTVRPWTRDERIAWLVERLGIREAVAAALPPDEPLPPPPKS